MCDGEDSEKLDWFRIINIAGEQLTDQELEATRFYAGAWTADAQTAIFPRLDAPLMPLAGDYLKGLIHTGRNTVKRPYHGRLTKMGENQLKEYMAKHQVMRRQFSFEVFPLRH